MLLSVVRILLVMLVAGWAAAGTPFRGDQALFAVSARSLADGSVLYRDVWDITNPGVYAFYTTAGTLFGWSEDGIHFAEWLWWLAFVFAVSVAVKRMHVLPHLPLAPAILVGGLYYLTAAPDPSHLTKTEGLVGFPLFVAAWLASDGRGWPRLLLAGIAGGVVLSLKLAFAPLLLAAWLPVLVVAVRQRRAVSFLVGLAAGGMLPIAAVVGYFAWHGTLAEAAETLFITPRQMVRATAPAGFDRLAHSVQWFVEVGSAVVALAALGVGLSLRRGQAPPLVVAFVLMLPAAAVVILVQRWSWWSYHFILLQTTVGVLAALTWPVIVADLRQRFAGRELTPFIFAAGLLFLPVLGHGGFAYLRLAGHRFGITAADRQAVRADAGRGYSLAQAECDWLKDRRPGPIFVAGDPLIHWLSGRPMATSMNGWSLELLTPQLWQRLTTELKAARPVSVFVSSDESAFDRLVRERGPELSAWLRDEYTVAHTTPRGTWYERRE